MVKRLAKGISEQELNEYQQNVQRSLDIQPVSYTHLWWKGKLQPGNYDKLISAMDFYPTALDAADISIPKDLKLDGVSLLPWLQDKKQGEPHKNLTWITSYSHWFDEENIPFWDNYHKFVRHQSDDYPHNPNTEDLSQFSYTVRNNDYSLVYTCLIYTSRCV